jgi:hypothetical protein
MAFIDGDHSYEAAKGDVCRIEPFLANQCVVCFHDSIQSAGVSRVIGEALISGAWMIGGHVNN